MPKPYFVVAAALAALVVPAMGAPLALAAEPSAGLHAPAENPNETPPPVPSASASTESDMAGMNHEGTPEGEHDETSGMNDEDMPGMSHGETPGSHEDDSRGSSATPAAKEGAESHPHREETVTEPRPVAAMVGAFAAVNGGIVISAAVLRRRDEHRANGSLKPARAAK